jgi:solute carrier family 45 protein 1/2/4
MAIGGDGPKKTGPALPMWKLFLIALPQLGVNVLWSFLVPFSAPYMKHLGAVPALATLNNIAGPITGFFTGPLAGAYSDSCTSKLGRRRPVILFGLVSFAIAGLVFSGAEHVLGSSAIYIAAPMYWVLDVTINVMQTPHRALAADFATEEQQFLVQIMFVFIGGCGNFVGFSMMEIYEIPIDHMLELMMLIFILNALLVAMQFVVAKETPLEVEGESEGPKSACAPLAGLGEATSHPVMRHLAFIQSVVWIGLMTWVAYGGQWFANTVFEGDGNAPKGSIKKQHYADGMQEFAFGGQVKSIVSLLFTLLIIFIMTNTSIRPRLIYAPCIFVGGVASLLAAMVVGHNGNFAVICMTMAEITMVGCFSFPTGLWPC